MKRVVMLGGVNVGKSTVFNYMVGKRTALVSHHAGATRDVRWGEVAVGEQLFLLGDTAGTGGETPGGQAVERLWGRALSEAAHVWLVADAKAGLTAEEQQLAQRLRSEGKSFFVVVNKAEGGAAGNSGELHRLGAELFMVSATHGRGFEALLERTAAQLGLEEGASSQQVSAAEPAAASMDLRFLLLGRPNVGKSSLVNMLLGEERMAVSEQAGTTHEAMSLCLPAELVRGALGQTDARPEERGWQVVDSVGVRRQARVEAGLERLGAAQSLGMLPLVHVVVLVLDGSQPPSRQDARLAALVLRFGRGLVLAMNKWDLLPQAAQRRTAERAIAEKLHFVDFAPRIATSTTHHSGARRLLRMIQRVQQQHCRQLRASDLNRALAAMAQHRPPPTVQGTPTRLLYAAQTDSSPPCFRFFTNHPQQIPTSYARYIEAQLRHHFGFLGTPLRLQWHLR